MAQKRKFIRNPAFRHLLFWGLIVLALLLGISFLPFGNVIFTILAWVVGIILALAAILFVIIMAISVGGAVFYWLKFGYLTNPWSWGPWGKYAEKSPRHNQHV